MLKSFTRLSDLVKKNHLERKIVDIEQMNFFSATSRIF